ncbi:Uncharacterised protein [Klebsiella pneumoniae subsp. rhinoscleromatis]|nr:Uncharacterised protein [Klebsiella pneumoniae subsp. rhinoscleromatis]
MYCGMASASGGDEVEAVAVEFGQRLGQGMDGTAILQIADHRHVEVFEAALGLLNGEQVEQGLGRVLVSAVAGVQYRPRRRRNSVARRAAPSCG